VRFDRRCLNLVAAVLCGVGSAASLLSARGSRDRAAMLAGFFGVIGSAAWAAAAYDDLVDARNPSLTTEAA